MQPMDFAEHIHTLCLAHEAVYRTWENFGVGKNRRIWQIECHLLIFYLPINSFVIISCSHTWSLFVNFLPAIQFRLAHSPIFYPSKNFPRTVFNFGNNLETTMYQGQIFTTKWLSVQSGESDDTPQWTLVKKSNQAHVFIIKELKNICILTYTFYV